MRKCNACQIRYFQQEDVLTLVIYNDLEAKSVEISPNITVELNSEGELIGIEIINASAFLRDSILESVQEKLLNLARA